MQAAIVPGGTLTILGVELTQLIEDHKPSNISPHLHLCFVTRGGLDIYPNNYTRHASASAPRVDFRMPKVATTWEEFDVILQVVGATAAGAAT
jgi:hypothetical protein